MRILISLPAQTLELYDDSGQLMHRYSVSTAAAGAGEHFGSFRTPRGRHVIRAKIGAGQPDNTVFVGRRPTGEIWSPQLAAAHPGRDWILTRILWLSGCEPGFNRLGRVDTMCRFIYLHGSPDSVAMGKPGSIGCVRMRNRDIVELFTLVPCGTPVRIVEYSVATGDWAELGAEAMPIRERVFVAEQGVPAEMELDEFDALATHVLACLESGLCIGTARLITETGGKARIGRMAVLAEWRGQGVGAALLGRLLEDAALAGINRLGLSAQIQAIPFYRRYGFVEEGSEYLDAGLRHMAMWRELKRPGTV
jgi:predicted GNAT family N-acyltransferase